MTKNLYAGSQITVDYGNQTWFRCALCSTEFKQLDEIHGSGLKDETALLEVELYKCKSSSHFPE
ncbi:hypothetical protein F443_15306 [Phytophthora nicotianae P1569]|uniref:Uncharacterized protein n=1 Tax=Phytophthora nicotianae P1569 TaxID=1317065 RepID=V9EKN1_PHYNI|nr:hypothetical protein F443_15306 [Phytophthora nicotianae P1569]